MKYSVALVFGLGVMSSLVHAGPTEPPIALKGLDPIALSEGKEVAGLASNAVLFSGLAKR